MFSQTYEGLQERRIFIEQTGLQNQQNIVPL